MSIIIWNIDKYEYLTGEEILPSDQRREKKQAKFTNYPLEKQAKTIEEQEEKQKEALENRAEKNL